jgi:phytoene dehydrogenase-like protein
VSREVLIISPEVTPGSGGLADYTLRIVQEWGDRADVRFSDGREIANFPRKILLQYSAYGFDPFGYPRSLLRSLIAWKRANPRSVLVVMLHEIWTFWPLLNKNRFVQSLHRRDLGKLARVADAVFTSTPSQAEHLTDLAGGRTIQVMPVGSNIPLVADLTAAREEGVAVLFGLQVNRIKTLREMRSDLQRATLRKVITFGGGNTAQDDVEQTLAPAAKFELRGAVTAEEASHLLARATFGISAQDPRSIMKSGTFMAYAAHGLNILSPYAEPLGAEPLCWLTSPSELAAGVAAEELKSRAENLRRWQERTASWPEIAQRFAEALQLET